MNQKIKNQKIKNIKGLLDLNSLPKKDQKNIYSQINLYVWNKVAQLWENPIKNFDKLNFDAPLSVVKDAKGNPLMYVWITEDETFKSYTFICTSFLFAHRPRPDGLIGLQTADLLLDTRLSFSYKDSKIYNEYKKDLKRTGKAETHWADKKSKFSISNLEIKNDK